MELSILLLEDALRQQKEQLNDTERRNVDSNSPAFEFRKKAIVNLKSFIADLEKGIEALTLLSKENEALILPVVGITFKEKIEKEIVELREELAKLLNDKLSAYTSVDDWSDKIAFITGKIEGLKSALN